MDLIFMLIVIFSASFSVFYSFKTRSFRKNGKFEMMKFYNAKANISMGLMLVAMGSIQLFSFDVDMTGWRMSIGFIFLALGLFNLYMGVRNYRIYLPKVMNNNN
jgi:predicted membrane channel-forming protein YqfA (hemolysin III family)